MKMDCAVTGQRMTARHDKAKVVFPIINLMQSQRRRAVGKDTEVGPAIQYGEHDFATVLFLEFDPYAGIGLGERSQFEWKKLGNRRSIGPESHHADDSGRIIGEFGSQQVDI